MDRNIHNEGGLPPGDEDLVARAKAGDKEAFVQIFKKYKDRIYAYLCRYLRNPETAEELTVETFLGAYNGLAKYEEMGRFLPWLYRIATNYAKRSIRDASKIKGVSLDETVGEEGHETIGETIADEKANPDNIIHQADVERLVRSAMSELDPKYKDVLMLCDVEGLKYDEAAKALKTNQKTIGTQLRRARMLLYEKLKKYKNELRGRLT